MRTLPLSEPLSESFVTTEPRAGRLTSPMQCGRFDGVRKVRHTQKAKRCADFAG